MRRKLILFAALVFVASVASGSIRRAMGDGRVAYLSDEQEIFLESPAEPGEGLLAFTRRYTGDAVAADEIGELNRSRRLLAGVRYRIPYRLLRPDFQLRVMESLFPSDEKIPEGWRHRVLSPREAPAESLWRIAEWFTGEGQNFSVLREVNDLVDHGLQEGQVVLIPRTILRPALVDALPRTVVVSGSTGPLRYARDREGEYAEYDLQAGEALYSAVIVRFTGRIFAEDVNTLAREVAERSRIRDVTDIPVSFPIKIPFDLLEPEYLPPGHARRVEYEASLVETTPAGPAIHATRLAGVTVVLDAGHGGRDVGASKGDVWESLYVYDIVNRVRRKLSQDTAAKVVVTTMDSSNGVVPHRDKLAFSRSHQVQTDPPYAISDTKTGVHLRWYLANSVYRNALKEGTPSEKMIFISIHADSLHPSLRGAMVYVPATGLRLGSFKKSGSVYKARKEYREKPEVSFAYKNRRNSEALSRRLAGELLGSLREQDMGVHKHKPVRDRIIRGRGRQYVPAVLRYNAIPPKVLLEVCNLANAQDRRLIQTQGWREKMADSVVEGLLRFYGGD